MHASPRFPHRRAFVTGVSSGLGREIARGLLEAGVAVWGTARDLRRLEGLVAEAAERSWAFTPVELELGDPEGASRLFLAAGGQRGGTVAEPAAAEAAETVPGEAGEHGFDLVVLNAGYGVFGPFEKVDWERWHAQLRALICGNAALAHNAFAQLGARKDGGTLVLVSSLAAEFPIPFMAGYNMAKAACSALAESLVLEAGDGPVRVLDFRPGDYRTDFNRAMDAGRPRGGRADWVWVRLEEELAAAAPAGRAAQVLLGALRERRRGVLRAGSFYQARLAPLAAAVLPAWLMRRLRLGHFGLR